MAVLRKTVALAPEKPPLHRSAGAPGVDPAFEAEALGHLPQLRKVSFGLTKNRADAEDLVQDAYLRAMRSSTSFQPGTNLKAWLLTILKNVTSNHRRGQRRATVYTDPNVPEHLVARQPARELSPEQALLVRTLAPGLRSALESLPKSLRDAVWLRDVDELSYADIASRLRIPIGTVMSRISRGRRLLHDRLVANSPSPVRQEEVK